MIDDERKKILKINTKYKKIVDRHFCAKIYRERFLYVFVFQAIKEETCSLHHNKKKINNKTYTSDLLNNMGISETFNVFDLYLYYDEKSLYLECGIDLS